MCQRHYNGMAAIHSPISFVTMAASSKERMLKKICKALTHATPQPFAGAGDNGKVFQPQSQDLNISFAEAFTKL